ncbi:MAG: hypothetical protein WCK49_04575 [Myxococcaceae bacterium]
MRTTLTLEDDVSIMLKKIQHELHMPFKQLINASLREGLSRFSARKTKPHKRFETQSVSVGECFLSNLDNISEILAITEGESYK